MNKLGKIKLGLMNLRDLEIYECNLKKLEKITTDEKADWDKIESVINEIADEAKIIRGRKKNLREYLYDVYDEFWGVKDIRVFGMTEYNVIFINSEVIRKGCGWIVLIHELLHKLRIHRLDMLIDDIGYRIRRWIGKREYVY